MRALNHPVVCTIHELIEFFPVYPRWLLTSIDPALNCFERHRHLEGKLPYTQSLLVQPESQVHCSAFCLLSLRLGRVSILLLLAT